MTDAVARERFEALWEANYADVFAFALRRVGDPQAAADIVADTFLVAWRRLDDLPDEPRAWLFGAARKTIGNSRRGQRRRQALVARIGELAVPSAGEPPEVPSDGNVAAAFNRLSDRDRELLSLIVWEELSPREAATTLGIPTARFSVRLHRAKQRLRKELRSAGHVGGEVAARPPAGTGKPDEAMETR